MTDEDRRLAHIAVLERYRDAWVAADIATMFGLYADDFILHWNGANPFAGTHAGKPAAIAALSNFTQKTDRKLIGVRNIMADADKAVMIARERLAGREVDRTLVYRTDGEKLLECWVLDADQAWIDSLLNA
jgi:ketosteroid isomerase-like protein